MTRTPTSRAQLLLACDKRAAERGALDDLIEPGGAAGRHRSGSQLARQPQVAPLALRTLNRGLLSDERVVVLTSDFYIRSRGYTADFRCEGRSGGSMASCRSKLGNLWFAAEFAKRFHELEIVVVHPGVIASNLGGKAKGVGAFMPDDKWHYDEQDAQARSLAWWVKTRRDEHALNRWLLDQYRGEVTAAGRILPLAYRFTGSGSREHRLLGRIADQERRHADWVAGLLGARRLPVPVQLELTRERYLASAAAVGAHAERMRLWRIRAIAADPQAPADVREVFLRILPKERFHERAFRRLAGEAALRAALDGHERGMAVLGLRP